MADNTKWILEHNPGEKIVVWAHNGHVAAGGYRGYDPMGGFSRQMYGADMVVFGFAFNQGSFQAIDLNGGRLREFTVPPSPADSLDGVFAAAGIPLIAVDLRCVPDEGPGSWLRSRQLTRAIGAAYDETRAELFFSELSAPAAFDAMLFVENTTRASRPVKTGARFRHSV